MSAHEPPMPARGEAPDERPPFATWPLLYAAVVAELALVIALCGWLSQLGR